MVSRFQVINNSCALSRSPVESIYPRKKETPRMFLESIVGDTKRQVENKRVEEVVSAGTVESDLRRALEVTALSSYLSCVC